MSDTKTDTKRASVPKLTDTFTKFQGAEFSRRTHVARPDFGLTLQQVMDAAYWGNVASKLRAGDLIELQPEGLTYWAQLIVVDASPVHANVKLLQFVDLVNDAPAPDQQEIVGEKDLGKFKVERTGRWFRVIRNGDGEVMKGGFPNLKAAEQWAAMNLQLAS
jgi:hypothetical protein